MKVTVYTKDGCQPCRATMRWLNERAIPFEEKYTGDPANLAEAKAFGYLGAPVVVFVPAPGESVSHWYGFRPDMLDVVAHAMGKTEKTKGAA
ncbi:glutaredoxin family protein [Microbacterium paludicola]|uniref:glutaredoxin family protein n=1 Tax=Microbacterium paludicola TaxID=300019 RepID=UPI0011A08D2F|nr:glutaredoxin family protein [Microbacterium paludicola]